MQKPHNINELISVNIVTWNSEVFVKSCLESVLSQTHKNLRIRVIDNGSTDQTDEIVKSYGDSIQYIKLDRNTGFSHAHNIGISKNQNDYILVMNPDVILTPTYLEETLKVMRSDSRIGTVGGKLFRWNDGPSGVIDSTGIRFNAFKRAFSDSTFDIAVQREVFGVTGACALYRRKMLEDVKIDEEYFDEDFFAYLEDVDLAWRARNRGWKAVYTPTAVAYHYRGAAQKNVSSFINNLVFRNRYYVLIKNDSMSGLLKVLPIFIIFEFLRYCKLMIILPRVLFQWNEILMHIPVMMKKRRLIQQANSKNAASN